jgi:hypothetical protein
VSPEERFKFDFLATLVHEGSVRPLAAWLSGSPEWTERFVTELLDDGFVALVDAPPPEPARTLAGDKARALLSSGEARTAGEVWIVPTLEGSREFDESNARAMFDFCARVNLAPRLTFPHPGPGE